MLRILLVASILLSSCVDFKNEYAPARTRRADTGPDPRGLKAFIDMKEGASLAHFAWGLSLTAFDGELRKAAPSAALRFQVPAAGNWKLSVDYANPTGQPVSFLVNGRKLGSSSSAGASVHFEAEVPANVLVADTATLLAIESQDGVAIARAGFLRR
jgi:hypothetical protein